jgi:hypothetical protein
MNDRFLWKDGDLIFSRTDKKPTIVRARAVTPYIESGNVYLPDPSLNPRIHDFIEECSKEQLARANRALLETILQLRRRT